MMSMAYHAADVRIEKATQKGMESAEKMINTLMYISKLIFHFEKGWNTEIDRLAYL